MNNIINLDNKRKKSFNGCCNLNCDNEATKCIEYECFDFKQTIHKYFCDEHFPKDIKD